MQTVLSGIYRFSDLTSIFVPIKIPGAHRHVPPGTLVGVGGAREEPVLKCQIAQGIGRKVLLPPLLQRDRFR